MSTEAAPVEASAQELELAEKILQENELKLKVAAL